MTTKKLQEILPPPPAHMVGDGFRVHNFFPSGYEFPLERMSPFFLLDYNSKIDFGPSNRPRGVGVHPHRGFETVTIAYHGKIAHHDSFGNSGIIGEGDVQWMTAGSGLLHKEYHEEAFCKKGGMFQMVQLWVNLPAKDKMSKPKYQGITHAQMGVSQLPDGFGKVEVIAGSYKGTKGPAFTFTPIELYNLHLKKGAKADFSFPASYNTAMLVIEGSVKIGGSYAPQDNLILFGDEGELIEVQADENAIVLVMSGKPIHEPIAAYGPFLMNTKEEIMQAYTDMNNGLFGKLND